MKPLTTTMAHSLGATGRTRPVPVAVSLAICASNFGRHWSSTTSGTQSRVPTQTSFPRSRVGMPSRPLRELSTSTIRTRGTDAERRRLQSHAGACERVVALILIVLGISLIPSNIQAQDTPAKVSKEVRFDQHLGQKLPQDLSFRDEAGKAVQLGDYFGRKPAILTLVYYRCPMLCGKELEALTRSIRALSLDVGRDFQIITVSISPEETPDLAAAKKTAYLKAYNRPGAERGWHFLTGDAKSIEKIADVAGFRYVYNPKTKLYAHAAGLVVLTPDGTIAKYFSGLEYPASILQENLKEAAKGNVGRPIGWVTLLCYDYDESTGGYTLAIMRLTRIFGTLTAIALGTYVVVMIRRDRQRIRSASAAIPAAPWGG